MAVEYAIPAPIMPAPKTPTLVACHFATLAGRLAPDLIAFRPCQKVPIIFLEIWPVVS